jgi:hypothetical protein
VSAGQTGKLAVAPASRVTQEITGGRIFYSENVAGNPDFFKPQIGPLVKSPWNVFLNVRVGKGMRRANLAQGGLGKCGRVGEEGLEPR